MSRSRPTSRSIGRPDAADPAARHLGNARRRGLCRLVVPDRRGSTEGASVPDDLAVVLIHAINPYGFAWIRRVNEDNVDLNRNCIDFGAAIPENPGYDTAGRRARAAGPGTRQPSRRPRPSCSSSPAEHGFDGLQDAVSHGPVPAPDRDLLRRGAPGVVAAHARVDRRAARSPVRSAPRSSICTPGSARSASASSSPATRTRRDGPARRLVRRLHGARARGRRCRPT